MRVRKGDLIQIISGEEKGKRGKVLKVFPRSGRAIVEGVNFIKKHTKPTRSGQPGGIVEKESPIQLSNLQLICPRCDKPTRLGTSIGGGGSKEVVCRRCGEVIER